mmetsp:Transcript_36157/g.84485  ORF Transcript_36157/g.84485 Transcript_36157/m.84485 type:complete len:127 (-) Transcript_36157:194-574(-)
MRAARLLGGDGPTLLVVEGASTAEARKLMRKYFSKPVHMTELISERARPLVEDALGRHTLALELIDTHVCAAANAFAGNLFATGAQTICYEREGLRGAALATGNLSAVPRPCLDIYDRSLKGMHWF